MSNRDETKKILYGVQAQEALEEKLQEEMNATQATVRIKTEKTDMEKHAELCAKLDGISTLLVKILSAIQSLSSSKSSTLKG